MKRSAVALFIALFFVVPASASALTPWIEVSGTGGVIGSDIFSSDFGLRGAVGLRLCSGLAIGAGYEHLNSDYKINSTYFFLDESRRFDVFSVFVQTRLLEKRSFSLWHGLAVGWLQNDSGVVWMTYTENELIDAAFSEHDVNETSTTLDSWLQALVPVSSRFGVTLGLGMRFLGIEDLSGAQERVLSARDISYTGSESSGDLRVYFRLGVEMHF